MIDVVGRRIMMFHVPVLLLHSFLFFILCRIYSDIATGPKGFYVDKKSYTFFYVYVGILLINFKWLYLILRIKYLKNDGYIRNFLYTILMAILPFLYNKDDNTPSHSDKPAGLWMMNNLQIAMLSIIILIIPFEENQADLIVITVALFYNSLIDLYINGYVYIFRKEG